MKQRTAERLPWPRVTARRFTMQAFATPEFHGVATLLCLDAVREPLWIEWQGRRFCSCDSGYTWLQHFPANTHYAITTQFDAQGQVVQWYIDICHRHWLDDQGMPWWEDPGRSWEVRIAAITVRSRRSASLTAFAPCH